MVIWMAMNSRIIEKKAIVLCLLPSGFGSSSTTDSGVVLFSVLVISAAVSPESLRRSTSDACCYAGVISVIMLLFVLTMRSSRPSATRPLMLLAFSVVLVLE